MIAIERILEWGEKVDLKNKSNINAQTIKFVEELGETAEAFRKKERDEVIDGIGDSIVVATMLLFITGIGKEIIIDNYKEGIEIENKWLTDNMTKNFNIFFQQASHLLVTLNTYPPKTPMPYRAFISMGSTLLKKYTKKEIDLEKCLTKVADILESRVKGIQVDNRGFAIKEEDRVKSS